MCVGNTLTVCGVYTAVKTVGLLPLALPMARYLYLCMVALMGTMDVLSLTVHANSSLYMHVHM